MYQPTHQKGPDVPAYPTDVQAYPKNVPAYPSPNAFLRTDIKFCLQAFTHLRVSKSLNKYQPNVFVLTDQTLPGFHHSLVKHVKVLKIGHSWDTFHSTSSRIIDCNCYLFIFRYVTFRCMFQTLSRPQSIDVSLNYSHSFNLNQFL